MNAAPTEPRPPVEVDLPSQERWPRHRWWLLVALVFGAHIGLIYALGDRRPIVPRPLEPAPELRLAVGSSELLALHDPTLFALPHPSGFSATAWRQKSQSEFPPFRWTEPPRWLALPVEQLGDTLRRFVQSNAFARVEFEALPAPQLASPEVRREAVPVARSTLRVTGDLAQRRLLNPINLTNWPSADLLTNSVVRVLVDTAGNVVSHKLLRWDSGSKDPDQLKADQRALELARAARFSPLPPAESLATNPLGRLSRGALIFEWHTVPLPATNGPPPNP